MRLGHRPPRGGCGLRGKSARRGSDWPRPRRAGALPVGHDLVRHEPMFDGRPGAQVSTGRHTGEAAKVVDYVGLIVVATPRGDLGPAGPMHGRACLHNPPHAPNPLVGLGLESNVLVEQPTTAWGSASSRARRHSTCGHRRDAREFVSFDDGIDLSGLQFSLGLHARISSADARRLRSPKTRRWRPVAW